MWRGFFEASALRQFLYLPNPGSYWTRGNNSGSEGGPSDWGDVEDNFRSTIGSWIAFFESNIAWFSETMIGIMKNAIKATYFTVGLAGVVMWATGIAKYSGKRLIIGAILMALVSEILL